MRKKIIINSINNFKIYGTLDSKNYKKLIIFIHGITGNQNEHQYFNAVSYFNKKGFDTFRFDFYPGENNSRSLADSTLATHKNDLENIINYFNTKYSKIFLVGHSLGGIVTLSSNLEFISKIVLWDPSIGFKSIKEKEGEFDSSLNQYILHWGMDIIVGKDMIKEWKSFNPKKLLNTLSVSCKFIFAGKENKYKLWESYLNKIKSKSDSVIIKNASHCFVEEGTEQELFKETYKWIK